MNTQQSPARVPRGSAHTFRATKCGLYNSPATEATHVSAHSGQTAWGPAQKGHDGNRKSQTPATRPRREPPKLKSRVRKTIRNRQNRAVVSQVRAASCLGQGDGETAGVGHGRAAEAVAPGVGITARSALCGLLLVSHVTVLR